MGRRKLEMKRIEDKSSRQVTFSKRRGGLIKKARHLSVLCDADVAIVVFSAGGKLYDFCSGGSSVEQILSRYEKSCLGADVKTARESSEIEFQSQTTRYRTCEDLLHAVKRFAEEPNPDQLSVTDLTELEEELDAALMQTRSRKTKLMMEYISTLHEKERKLSEENEEIVKQVVFGEENVAGDDGDERLNDLATNQTNLIQRLTLPLFPG